MKMYRLIRSVSAGLLAINHPCFNGVPVPNYERLFTTRPE